VFTQHIPRTGKSAGNTKHTPAVRFGAALGTVALVSGATLIAPAAASADEASGVSYAHAEFFSGDLLGADITDVVGLGRVTATNDGSQSLQVSRDPLTAEALGTKVVDIPGGLQLPLLDAVDAGAINQYAQADKNGESFAASGAIGNDGGIGVGNVGDGSAGDLSLDLDKLLSNELASVLSNLSLDLEGVAARADGSMTTASGDYTLADATLSFSSPAIGQLTSKVTNALNGVDTQLLSLGGDNGALGNSIDSILDPVLGVIGSSADVTVVVDADLDAAVSSLLTGDYSSGGVSFNLETGAVMVDLETVLGSDLNDLAPNTELLTDAVVNRILNGITETVATLADDIVDRVELALRDARVEVSAELDLLTEQDPVQSTVCHDIEVPIIGDVVGGLLGGITQGVIGYTTETVCELVDTVLPDLRSTVDVNIVGTVDGLINGVAAEANADISLLGGTVATGLSVNALIGSLGDALDTALFSSGGVLTSLVNSLNTGLVNPAVTGLLGDSGVGTVLRDLVSITVNVQERWTSHGDVEGDMFAETAVRVAVGQGSVATVNLATAVVGPNVQTVVDPGCTQDCDPDGPGTPIPDPCIGICLPGSPELPELPTLALDGQLAYTGAGIATLIALIVALLAAGAYFARQGYLRTHPKSVL